MQNGIGFTRVTTSSEINNGPTLLFGYNIEASVDADELSIYEGNDTSSGRLLGTFSELASSNAPHMFEHPIYLDRGLYASIGRSTTAVTLFWLPVRNEGV